MSLWRLISVAATVAAFSPPVSAQPPFDSAQGKPKLDVVLKRAADYVAGFRKQLSGIAAEETYTQEIVNIGRFVDALKVNPQRRLKSDLLLIKPDGTDRYVELRDVFEVDGAPVRDRQARLEKLLQEPAAGAGIGAIITESARYNLGRITRNINTPLMALQFLDAANQPRMRFRHIEQSEPVFPKQQDAPLNDAPVFRVATEIWTIEFRERERATMIRTPEGRDIPARGRFWINPASGSVLISELTISGDVDATVTVSYQSEPLMGFLVPVEMRESYDRSGERITGHAEYGRFRPIAKSRDPH